MKTDEAILYIVGRLRNELPKTLYYHGVKHTEYVIKAARFLSNQEELSETDASLLITAAAYHDCGFLIEYNDNERHAVTIIKQELPKFGYTIEEIEIISSMIMATEIKFEPVKRLNQLICDADFYYIGGKNYPEIAGCLRKELSVWGSTSYTEKEWIEMQVRFLTKHKYYSESAIINRRENKFATLKNLSEQLSNL